MLAATVGRGIFAAVTAAWLVCAVTSASAQSPPIVPPVFFPFDRFNRDFLRGRFAIEESVVGFFDFVTQVNTLQSGEDIQEFESFRDEASAAIDAVPIPSGSISVLYTLDPKLETFVRFEAPFAPALSQNARTNGRGVLTLGSSYSYLDYRRFEEFDRERVIFFATDVRAADGSQVRDDQGRPAVVGELYSFELRKHVFAMTAEYGVLDNLDVGLFVPLIQQSFEGDTIARFYLQNGDGSLQPALVGFDDNDRPVEAEADQRLRPLRSIEDLRLSSFNVPAGDEPLHGFSFDDDTFGIGDVIVRTKYFIGSYGLADLGATLNIAFPTGNEDDLLGVGAVRIDPRVVASAIGSRLSGHVNLGFHADTEESDRNRVDYSIGGEVKVTPWLTCLVDQVARMDVSGEDPIARFEIVPGIKANPQGDVVFGLNAIVPLNHDGLTTDWTPNASGEISFQF
jgi:hypothetical protein